MADTPPAIGHVAEGPSRTCAGCRFALFHDEGWSNWTVEGKDFFCLLGAHPNDGFDGWYKTDHRLNFGADCRLFEDGDPMEMDVDRENEADLTPEELELFKAWKARP